MQLGNGVDLSDDEEIIEFECAQSKIMEPRKKATPVIPEVLAPPTAKVLAESSDKHLNNATNFLSKIIQGERN